MIDSLSIFLAKFLGLSLLIIGIALFSKYKDFQDTVKDVSKNDAIMTIVSIMPLISGLALVISHNVWEMKWIVVITIISWLILITGFVRLFFHKEMMKKMAKMSGNKNYFIYSGIVLFLVGLYLCGKGFFLEKFIF